MNEVKVIPRARNSVLAKQLEDSIREEGLRLISKPCLIVFDVDGTVLQLGKNIGVDFTLNAGLELVKAAKNGVNIGLISGNSMQHLCKGVLSKILEKVCELRNPMLLTKFHFFSNSGGAYFHFANGSWLSGLCSRATDGDAWQELPRRILRAITDKGTEAAGNEIVVRAEFIDANYLERFEICAEDRQVIQDILSRNAETYYQEQRNKISGGIYDFQLARDKDLIDKHGKLRKPHPEQRLIRYGVGKEVSVQLSLKPLLSHKIFLRERRAKDPRRELINKIQRQIDSAPLTCHYVVRPGGATTIDVTRETLDKATALMFLIQKLHVEGSARKGERFGSNTIYFGNEVVIGSGNDYPITRIPGVLIFAVNAIKTEVPFLSIVQVGNHVLTETEATAAILSQFNTRVSERLAAFQSSDMRVPTAVDDFKRQWFTQRIKEKVELLLRGQAEQRASVEQLQMIHTMVTLMSRTDAVAKEFIGILGNELDAIMTQLESSRTVALPAIGTSHRDNL